MCVTDATEAHLAVYDEHWHGAGQDDEPDDADGDKRVVLCAHRHRRYRVHNRQVPATQRKPRLD